AAIVANGEILNHHALRAALGKELFLTDSDCETILAAFRSAHPRWIAEPDGMFAFVIATPDRVIAARDPLGIKPLYVGRRDNGLAFASELKSFDGEAFDDVSAIAPGTLLDSATGTREWFRMPPGAATTTGDDGPMSDDQIDVIARELRAVLEAAVAKWLVADVEVGCFLSGGLDSSIVAALAQQQLGGGLKTFAVGTTGSPDLAAAARVAAHIGSDHHEATFTAEDLADAVPDVVRAMETTDPDTVRSGLPTYFVTQLARAHVKTVLSGEGADELFAGYAYHHAYADQPRAMADELTRSLGAMHNINLQRVDRVTMARALEARPPFLDRDLIAFAQTIPAAIKMRKFDDGATIEKWILRKSCEDLLPHDLVWRKKAQFDEGSGTVDALDDALAIVRARYSGFAGTETDLYEHLIRQSFTDPELFLKNAGRWSSGRVDGATAASH
ncbi:MAG: asparagine synthase-related protein, partial [Pseudomonadota bacterium]